MTKRNRILHSIAVAIAKGDRKTAMRLYFENRISKRAFDRAVMHGEKMKQK